MHLGSSLFYVVFTKHIFKEQRSVAIYVLNSEISKGRSAKKKKSESIAAYWKKAWNSPSKLYPSENMNLDVSRG